MTAFLRVGGAGWVGRVGGVGRGDRVPQVKSVGLAGSVVPAALAAHTAELELRPLRRAQRPADTRSGLGAGAGLSLL